MVVTFHTDWSRHSHFPILCSEFRAVSKLQGHPEKASKSTKARTMFLVPEMWSQMVVAPDS